MASLMFSNRQQGLAWLSLSLHPELMTTFPWNAVKWIQHSISLVTLACLTSSPGLATLFSIALACDTSFSIWRSSQEQFWWSRRTILLLFSPFTSHYLTVPTSVTSVLCLSLLCFLIKFCHCSDSFTVRFPPCHCWAAHLYLFPLIPIFFLDFMRISAAFLIYLLSTDSKTEMQSSKSFGFCGLLLQEFSWDAGVGIYSVWDFLGETSSGTGGVKDCWALRVSQQLVNSDQSNPKQKAGGLGNQLFRKPATHGHYF